MVLYDMRFTNTTERRIEMRFSNIELLRILCMLMIIGGHTIGAHKTTYDLSSFDEVAKLPILSVTNVAVDTFVIISGYFGIKMKLKKLAKLEMQVIFYSVALFFTAILLGWHTLNIKADIAVFMPILTKRYWFITCYFVLYIISPLLNEWAESLSKQRFGRLLIAGALLVYVWPTYSYLLNTNQFISDAGFGIVNFSYLYMLGRFIKTHYIEKYTTVFYWGGYFFDVTLLFACHYSLSWIFGFEFTSFYCYNTIFIFVGAVFLFMAFKNMSFSSRIVNWLAKPCLAVYLIHFNGYIWHNACRIIDIPSYHGIQLIVVVLLIPVVIYLVCVVIEFCRIRLFGKLENYIVSLLSLK